MGNIQGIILPNSEDHIFIDGTLWSGHRAAWEALTTEEQSKYRYVMFDDDSETGETVDAVTDGDMRAVTSNAVHDALDLENIGIELGHIRYNFTDSTTTLTLSEAISNYRYIEIKMTDSVSYQTMTVFDQMLLGIAEVKSGQKFRVGYYTSDNIWERFDIKYISDTELTITHVSGNRNTFYLLIIGREKILNN